MVWVNAAKGRELADILNPTIHVLLHPTIPEGRGTNAGTKAPTPHELSQPTSLLVVEHVHANHHELQPGLDLGGKTMFKL
jgi:hypothetical protein